MAAAPRRPASARIVMLGVLIAQAAAILSSGMAEMAAVGEKTGRPAAQLKPSLCKLHLMLGSIALVFSVGLAPLALMAARVGTCK